MKTLDFSTKDVITHQKPRLRIAYVMQNAGNNDLTSDTGPAILIKYTLHGLRKAGHKVNLLMLKGRSVVGINDISAPSLYSNLPLGITNTRPFLLAESGVRRLQRELQLPYLAFFDTYRFYEACCRCLPHYDLCHEYHGLFSLGAALACYRRKIPYILTVDADLLLESAVVGSPLQGLHALIARWEAKLVYQLAQKIICVSEPAKQHFVNTWRIDPEKIVVIPNGVDVGTFGQFHAPQSVRKELSLPDNVPVVMFVGSFQLWHGLGNLVEIFTQVLQELPNARLLLVGDGPARTEVAQKCLELGITDKVIITGLVSHARIPKILAIADVVTIPYPPLPKEMWFSPLKLYEYMAAGKAIVSSNDGQIAEVIQHGHNGLLIESGNVVSFAQAIIGLLKDPAERERLGQNARQQAIERHSWEQYINGLEEIYSQVLR